MPLNRDQQRESNIAPSAANYAAERQHARSSKNLPPNYPSRPTTPQNSVDGKSRRDSMDGQFKRTSKKCALNPEHAREDLQNFKVPVKTGLPPKKVQGGQQQSTNYKMLLPNQHRLADLNDLQKSKKPAKVSGNVFDDTTSLDQSFLDQSILAQEVTAFLKQNPEESVEVQDVHMTARDQGGLEIQRVVNNTVYADSWQEEARDKLDFRPQKTHQHRAEPQTSAPGPNYSLPQDHMMGDAFDDYDPQLETPSRTQSVPPIGAGHNVHRKVDFANTPQIFGGSTDSPGFRSAELARESSPDLPPPRPNSIQPGAERMPMHHKSNLKETSLHSRPKQNLNATIAQSSRFGHLDEHKQRFMQQNQKVSAPESDAQQSSEDEQAGAQPKNASPFSASEDLAAVSRKRSRESDSGLDYISEELKNKTLSSLQQEPFTRSPSENNKPRTDGNGNEMFLSQLLDNLKRIQVEDQRDIFRTQTDEEWSQTGQWFVNKFQDDLKKLMVLRLERRKIALRYEDKVRRRQREVEWAQDGVEKELQELESGGGKLIRNRKAPSRAGTPMRPPRG